MDQKLEKVLDFLVRFNDNAVTDQQQIEFRDQLHQDDELLRYYAELTSLFSQFHRKEFKPDVFFEDEMEFDSELWKQLAESEKNAPHKIIEKVIRVPEISLEKPQPEKPQSKSPRFKKKPFFSVLSAAAMFMLLLLAHFYDPTFNSVEIATITDTIQADWASDTKTFAQNDRIMTRKQPYVLTNGYAELLFDNQVRLTIEAPATFRLLKDQQVELIKGLLYAAVPTQVDGFTVITKNSKIIDLGTEFGVSSTKDGTVEYHVTNGKTKLLANNKSNSESIYLTQGNARKISEEAIMTSIPFEQNKFAQRIDSSKNLVWKGQNAIDLADIVCGGNGLNTGEKWTCLDPVTGQFMTMGQDTPDDIDPAVGLQGPDQFNPVHEHDFIDGVFVLNSLYHKTVISSQGHLFTEQTNSNGHYLAGLSNSGYYLNDDYKQIVLDNHLCQIVDNPCLVMPGNVGITYDLNKIRQTYDQFELTTFTTICSNTASLTGNTIEGADFYVLINGMSQSHHLENVKPGQSLPLTITIRPEDQFLTLISVTNSTILNDTQAVFGNPRFEIEFKK